MTPATVPLGPANVIEIGMNLARSRNDDCGDLYALAAAARSGDAAAYPTFKDPPISISSTRGLA